MSILSAFRDYRESKRDDFVDETTGLQTLGIGSSVKSLDSAPHFGNGGGQWGSARIFETEAAWDQYLDRSWGGNTKIDFAAELGDLSLSRLIMAAVRWISKNLSDGRFQVVSLDSDSKETEQTNHKLVSLMRRPNPYYSGRTLLRGFAASWLMAATVYFLIIRNRVGEPIELWYEPHQTIKPRWPTDGSEFISHYELWRNGQWRRIEKEDVFVCRDGIDPETRCGTNGLLSVFRAMFSEAEADQYTALLMKKCGVPPIAFTTKVGATIEDSVFRNIMDMANRKVSGDKRGEILGINGAIDVQKLGFDYSKIGMREIHEISEAEFCSVIGISPQSLYFMLSQRSSTYNNVKEFLRHDYIQYIMPTHGVIGEELDVQVLPSFQTDSFPLRSQWNYDKVQILQADKDSEWKRAGDAFKNRGIDQAEYREAIGYKSDKSHVGVYYPVPSNTITLSPIGESPIDDGIPEDVKPNGSTKPN
jgi:phage portal protein BeeE